MSQFLGSRDTRTGNALLKQFQIMKRVQHTERPWYYNAVIETVVLMRNWLDRPIQSTIIDVPGERNYPFPIRARFGLGILEPGFYPGAVRAPTAA